MRETLTGVTQQYGSRHLRLVPSYDDHANAYLVHIYIHDDSFERRTTHVGLLNGYGSKDEALDARSTVAVGYIDSLEAV